MFLLLACLTIAPSDAGSPRPTTEEALPQGHDSPLLAGPILGIGEHETDLVELLDLDLVKGKAALKVVFHEDGFDDADRGGSLDCGYAGMKEHPTSGVTLALFDLGSGAIEEFPVYPLAREPSECASQETSERTLAAAKKAMVEAGLDVKKKPAPVSPDAKGAFAFPGYEPVVAWSHTITADDAEEWKRLVDPVEEPDFSMGAGFTGLRIGPAVIVSAMDVYSRNMAGGAGTDFALAWQDGARAVFLVESWYRDMRSGRSSKWGLTRAIDLKPAE